MAHRQSKVHNSIELSVWEAIGISLALMATDLVEFLDRLRHGRGDDGLRH
jgi:hypothetical protein